MQRSSSGWRGPISKRLDLVQRRLLHSETDIEQRVECSAQARVRLPDILHSVSGIDQDEAAIGLDQLVSAGKFGEGPFAFAIEEATTQRTIGPAVEIMDAHQVAPLRPMT